MEEKMKENKKFVEDVDKLTAQILMQIDEMLTNEDCENYIKLSNKNATEFFTALIHACCHKLIKTGTADDLIQAHNVYNTLIVQYLLRNSGVKI